MALCRRRRLSAALQQRITRRIEEMRETKDTRMKDTLDGHPQWTTACFCGVLHKRKPQPRGYRIRMMILKAAVAGPAAEIPTVRIAAAVIFAMTIDNGAAL